MTKFVFEGREPARLEKKGWYYEKIVACRVPEDTHKNVVAYQKKHNRRKISTAMRELLEKGLKVVA